MKSFLILLWFASGLCMAQTSLVETCETYAVESLKEPEEPLAFAAGLQASLTMLQAKIDRNLSQNVFFVVLYGKSGAGKSFLISQIENKATSCGWKVLRSEGGVPSDEAWSTFQNVVDGGYRRIVLIQIDLDNSKYSTRPQFRPDVQIAKITGGRPADVEIGIYNNNEDKMLKDAYPIVIYNNHPWTP